MTNGCCPCLRQTSDDDGSASTKKKKPKPKPEPEPKPNPFAEDMAESIHVLKNVISLRRNGLKDKYSLGEELGRGEFGITYLCTDRQTDEKLACKSISKKKLRTAVDVEDVRREVTIMASLPDHPNIVRLRAAYEDAEAVYLIMELCHGGELFDRISSRGRYEEREAAVIFRTIIEVVRTCHDHGVIHRDLKPENFLFENGREDSALKAIDFGLSVFFLPGERLSEIVGSPFYMAPEVFKRSYGPEIDVWSAGVILYILLSGVPPFWAETEQDIARAILRGRLEFERDPWPQVSDAAKNLVRRMLHPDPTRRPTPRQILQHQWLRNTRKSSNAHLREIVRARLKQFSTMNRFKKKTMMVIAQQLSVEEVGVVRNMFHLMDTDKDARITYEELKAGLQKVGSQLGEPEIKLIMESADVDGNGLLGYTEFLAITIHLQRIESEEHLRRAFEFFDKDGSGFIEVAELGEILAGDSKRTDASVVEEIMREVDRDKDGRVSYEEFLEMMKAGSECEKASRERPGERLKSPSKDMVEEGTLILSR